MKNTNQVNEEKIIEKGNFWFLEKVNIELYNQLLSAESKARLDFKGAGRDCRDALELIINYIIKDSGLDKAIKPDSELYKKIYFLRDEASLKKAGYLSQNQSLKDKNILPDLGKVKYLQINSLNDENDYYYFMRRLGNSSSHMNIEKDYPKVNYENIIKALKGFHILCKRYFSNRISKDIPVFNEGLMHIGKYHIYDSYVPNDSIRSKCIRELLGYMNDSSGNKAFYAVLRLYKKTDMDEKFLMRNSDTYAEASKYSYSSVPEGMIRTEELTEYSSEASSFYIIAYIFNREPIQLGNRILKEMDLGKRVKLCKRIADCFLNLHQLETPIYHRMLSYESIYVCDYKKEWIPFVIKFDFAKINTGSNKGTVINDAIKAKNYLQEFKLLKYLAPEWGNAGGGENINWGKVDLYALGMLFSDILNGALGPSEVEIEHLKELGLSEYLLKLLDSLRADMPSKRVDIDEVQFILEEEAKRWR